MSAIVGALTMRDRVAAYNAGPGQKWPASQLLYAVEEQGREVAYGVWVIGAFFRNDAALYGAHPRSYLERVLALFPDVGESLLHACSGSLPPGPYVRLDLNPARAADIVGNVYDAPELLSGRRFRLITCDPPYSDADAVKYGTAMIDRQRAIAALAHVVEPGGHLVWLDQVWPVHNKTQFVTVGRIALIRSTNHRVRLISIFERVA